MAKREDKEDCACDKDHRQSQRVEESGLEPRPTLGRSRLLLTHANTLSELHLEIEPMTEIERAADNSLVPQKTDEMEAALDNINIGSEERQREGQCSDDIIGGRIETEIFRFGARFCGYSTGRARLARSL